MTEEQDSDSVRTSWQHRLFDGIGALFTIVWIVLLINGWDQKWFAKLPVVPLLLLLVGLLLAKHFVIERWSLSIRWMIHGLQNSSRHSNAAFVLNVCVSALIGGIAGWMLIIRQATPIVAAGTAAFGAILMGVLACLVTQRQRQSPPDESSDDLDRKL